MATTNAKKARPKRTKAKKKSAAKKAEDDAIETGRRRSFVSAALVSSGEMAAESLRILGNVIGSTTHVSQGVVNFTKNVDSGMHDLAIALERSVNRFAKDSAHSRTAES